MKRVDIGLLGCGTVGRGFVQLLDLERTRVRNRYGIDLSISRIAVRDLNKPRAGVDERLLTTSTLDAIQSVRSSSKRSAASSRRAPSSEPRSRWGAMW